MNDSEATEQMSDPEFGEPEGKKEGAEESASAAQDASTPEGRLERSRRETAVDERHSDLAEIIEGAESESRKIAREKSDPGPPDQSSGAALDQKPLADSAAAEQTGSYAYPDAGAASSQRLRLIPPDGKPMPWWIRYRRHLVAVEWFLTGLFFLLALYFLIMWIFARPAFACVPDSTWKMAAKPGRWRAIVVHHTATAVSSPQSIDRYHRDVRKWEGLGYHFLIGNGRSNGRDPTLADGSVHTGVRWLEQRDGAHVRMKDVKSANSFSIGIALIGNFELDPPTPRQIAALRCLLGFLSKEYRIPAREIHGHGEVSEKHTLCPGKLLPLSKVVSTLQ